MISQILQIEILFQHGTPPMLRVTHPAIGFPFATVMYVMVCFVLWSLNAAFESKQTFDFWRGSFF